MSGDVPTLRFAVSLDADDIAWQMERGEATQFVKLLDEAIGEWDFTLGLADYFDAKRAEHAKELAEDVAKAGAK